MSDQSPFRRRKNRVATLATFSLLGLFCANYAAAQTKMSKQAPVHVPSVSSTAQQNGVTAGYVAQLNQTVLPSLVRGPQLEKLKTIFTDGARLKRFMVATDLNDQQIDLLCNQADRWASETFSYLSNHVSAYAAERFLFRQPQPSMIYNLPGQHGPGYADKWGNTQRGLSELLVNLDQLMRDPSIYPENQQGPR